MLTVRERRGIDIFTRGGVQKLDDSRYVVKSSKSSGQYNVQWRNESYVCECPDFQKQKKKCKHIYAVMYYERVASLSQGLQKDEIRCRYCGSSEIVKRGLRYRKSGPVQRYFCQKCRRRFTYCTGEKHAPHTVVKTLDLYFKGLSLRQVAEHMASVEHVKLGHTTILRWLRKYAALAGKYLEGLSFKADRWSADEMVVRLNGRKILIWNLLDEKSRYLIATRVADSRSEEEARRLLEQGKKIARLPQEIVTDSAPCYQKAVEGALGKDTVHIAGVGLKATVNNNKIERFHRTMKARIRLMGAFRSRETAEAFIDGFRFYYNCVKPHRSLEGATPAETLGLTKGRIGWKEILNTSPKNRQLKE